MVAIRKNWFDASVRRCFFIWVLAGFFPGFSPAENLDSLLVVLDSCIMQRETYEQRFLHEQDLLWKKAEQEPEKDKAVELWTRIEEREYRYKADRAIHALNKACQAARRAGDKQAEYRFILRKASIYGMVGLPWDAQALLDSVLQQKDLSPFWRKEAYSIYYDSYGIYRLNLLPRELSDQRLHEVRVVEDSLKAIGQDAVRAAFTFDRSSANVPYMIGILQDKLKREVGKNKAVTAYVLANKYALTGDITSQDYYRALSAIYCIRCCVNELPALLRLTKSLLEKGDRERAYRYALAAYENADIYGSSVRKAEASSLLAVALKAKVENEGRTAKFMTAWRFAEILLLLSACMVAMMFYGRYRRVIKLCVKLRNDQKNGSDYINALKSQVEEKDEYVTRFLELSLDAVYEVEQLRRISLMRIKAGEYERLKKTLTDTAHFGTFQKESLQRFDLAFLRLYPEFPRKVNRLLLPDGQIRLSDTQLLNNELRILAFMKLGVTDGSRISTILGISVNTLYFYRNRLKRSAVSRDSFENDVMAL